MALAVVVPAQVFKGQTIKVTASGATHSGELDIAVSADENAGGVAVSKAKLAADSSGNFDSTGQLDFAALEEGHVTVTVTDVTAVSTVVSKVPVFSEG